MQVALKYWLVFQNDKIIITENGEEKLLSESDVAQLRCAFNREHQLGNLNNCDLFCAEISAEVSLPDTFKLVTLRQALDVLGDNWYQAGVKAKSIISWDKNHTFCGSCGAKTIHVQAYERKCSACGLAFYPRISPSMIVLIHKGDEVLMARSHHFPEGIYGLIAGFVEAGESIEEAVHREVMEEVGIKVKNLRYYGSQSWPFPDSLMVGFYAEYESGELQIDDVEIEDAGWFHYNNLPGRPSSQISIASKLLINYLAQKNEK